MALKITAVTVYALLTATLALLKGLKVDSRGRGAVKMITAAMFVSVGIYGCVTNGEEYGFVLVIGLAFAFLGDLFLVFMNKRALFISGVISFSCASLTFTVYAVLRFGFQWWALAPFALLCFVSILCQVKKVYDFGSCAAYLNVYTVLVTLCDCTGLVLLFKSADVNVILFGIGCLAYMLSDLCLGLYLYKLRHRWVDIINTLLYFPGLFLIAFSLIV